MNRLTLITVAGFGLTALLILLAMFQVDRQWRELAEIREAVEEQRDRIGDLRRELARRPAATGAAEGQERPTVPPAFQRAHEASQEPDFAPGDWRVHALGQGLDTLTPLVSTDAYASEIQNYVLESLLVRHPETLEWQGLLARDWEVAEDGLTITFELRRGLRFSDGEPLTAEDVAFSYDFIMDEDIAAPRQRAYYRRVQEVEAVDEHTVVFRFAEPYFKALSLAGGLPVLAEHYYGRFREDPEAFNNSRSRLFGSGPYRFPAAGEWTPDSGRVELERNPRYWGPVEPSFRRLVWEVIENDSARLTTYRNGDIDLYQARPREFEDLLEDPALMERSESRAYMSPTGGYSYIAWNQREGAETPFHDPRVRRAMTFLTDREALIQEVLAGHAEVAVSPFNPRSPQHDDGIEPRGHDPERARALLAEAGWEDRNGDGVLEDEAGNDFSFELTYVQASTDTQRVVEYLRDAWARAGVEMVPRPTEWSVMLEAIDQGDYDAITLGWTSDIEIDIYQMFHSSQIGEGDNYVGYSNPELDAVIEQARATVEEGSRMALWHRAERHLFEDQPYTFLFRRETLLLMDDRFRNVQQTRLGLNADAVPVEWYVPAAAQRY
ncbi:peptide/nickel transport system substrate-binding protein [Thiohalospira halophila DSM 15071]|uniref:Peptide/nickel transport system substrate-binding protein n=2 Tax=Thiohalospira halophila TaxID=381300 RepID=A0A1I1P6B9_9GAMM|nr:peptide/nickel transport system substrate-binding protein [Thiohalospira halophila DSM 15071]